MAANGISTMIAGDGSDPIANKAARQQAKLDLAQAKRQAVGTADFRYWNIYDINTLPAPYGVPEENLIRGVKTRPWADSTQLSNWILSDGTWDDSGAWEDDQQWNDGT